jgi:hypothetical protein
MKSVLEADPPVLAQWRQLTDPPFAVLRARGRVPDPDAKRAVLRMLTVFKMARGLPAPPAPPPGTPEAWRHEQQERDWRALVRVLENLGRRALRLLEQPEPAPTPRQRRRPRVRTGTPRSRP